MGLYIETTKTVYRPVALDSLTPTCLLTNRTYQNKDRFKPYIFLIKPGQNLSETIRIDSSKEGVFHTFWINCDTDRVKSYSFDLYLEQYNVIQDTVNYLSYSEIYNPKIYLAFSIIHFILLLIWFFRYLRKSRTVNIVHYMMSLLMILKISSLISQSVMFYDLSRLGNNDGWNIATYIFRFLKTIIFFTVVIMIGTGWRFIKPFLNDDEKKIFYIVIPLQIISNIALIISEETSLINPNWNLYIYIFKGLDILCSFIVLLPIIWSKTHLRSASEVDGKTKQSLEKLFLFRMFYLSVVGYLYLSSTVGNLISASVSIRNVWTRSLFEELFTLIFFVFVAIQFRPVKENSYFKLDENSEEELENLS